MVSGPGSGHRFNVRAYQQQKDAARGKELVGFLKWAVTDGQKISPSLDYAALPPNVQQRVLVALATVKY